MKVWVVSACDRGAVAGFTNPEKAEAMCNAYCDCSYEGIDLDVSRDPEVDLGLTLVDVIFNSEGVSPYVDKTAFVGGEGIGINECVVWRRFPTRHIHCRCWARDATHAIKKASKAVKAHVITGFLDTKCEVIND